MLREILVWYASLWSFQSNSTKAAEPDVRPAVSCSREEQNVQVADYIPRALIIGLDRRRGPGLPGESVVRAK